MVHKFVHLCFVGLVQNWLCRKKLQQNFLQRPPPPQGNALGTPSNELSIIYTINCDGNEDCMKAGVADATGGSTPDLLRPPGNASNCDLPPGCVVSLLACGRLPVRLIAFVS